MQIVNKQITEIKPYEKNPRRNDAAVKYVAESIKEFGFKIPIVIDKDGVIVCGHTRYKAARKLKIDIVPCIMADDLTEEQIKAFRLADNKVSEKAEWDFDLLDGELADIVNIDMFGLGFEEDDEAAELASISEKYDKAVSGTLANKFIVPPFSIFDARQDTWQARKKVWKTFLDNGLGGVETLLGADSVNGTSTFDPVLCEILLNWYSSRGDKVLDPFAGESVRGIVSATLGRQYYGNDLRQERVNANNEEARVINGRKTVFGTDVVQPKWSVGDSKEIDAIIDERNFKFMLACPPFADTEHYSEDPKDLSNMDYDKFLETYREILNKSVDMLDDNAFAAVVVGEIRDDKGYYRNFIGDTIKAMEDAGAKYYNEIIFITAGGGSTCYTAGNIFESSRKVADTHRKALIFLKSNGDEKALQEYIDSFDKTREVLEMKKNILIFLKGNSKLAKNAIETYDFELF